MKTAQLSKRKLRNYLINRSFLHQKAKTIHQVLEQYRCVQVDPINIVGRNHELVLWNRVQNFKNKDLYEELYNNRSLFEYWLQLYSIIPMKFYPHFSTRMFIKKDWPDEFLREYHREIEQVLNFITLNGVTGYQDLTPILNKSKRGTWTKSTKSRVLEYLWDSGKVMIHHRKGNQKFFDLTQRILPTEFNQKSTQQQSLQFLLTSNFHYVGLVRQSFLNRVGYTKRLNLKKKLLQLLKKGQIIKLDIPGVQTEYFVLNSQLEQIEKLGQQNYHSKLNIIPPLDPLVIDRKLLKDIFDFEYTWEAYTPASKRKFGYYGMPILFRGQFVGQVELRRSKGNHITIAKLEIKSQGSDYQKYLTSVVGELETFTSKGAW